MATVSPDPRITTTTLVSASAGPFLVGFRLFEADGLTVTVDGVAREDWTLTANLDAGFSDSASITFDAALDIDAVLTIEGTMIPEREEDYLPTERNLTDKLNAELARVWATLIEQAFRANGALRATTSQAAVDLTDNSVPIFKDGIWQQGPLVENIEEAEALLDALTGITTDVTTLAAGAEATASFDDETGVLSLGIPRGDTGATGASGAGSGDLVSTQNLSDLDDIPTARTNLGLGSAALRAAEDTLTNGDNLPDGAAITTYVAAQIAATVTGWTYSAAQNWSTATALDFTGIPSGVNEIVVQMFGVSLSGADSYLVQVITGAGVVATGYVGNSTTQGRASVFSGGNGFIVRGAVAAKTVTGSMWISLFDASTALQNHRTFESNEGFNNDGNGYLTGFTGPITGIRFTRTGANTGDAGSVRIGWRT